MGDHKPISINLAVRMKLEDISALLCDGFSIIPYPVLLRVYGIPQELRGEIHGINDAEGTIEFVDSTTNACTNYDMTQIISVSDVPIKNARN